MSRPRPPAPVTLAVALMLAVMISAIGVVYTKHESRKLFIELQAVSRERDELNIEWGKLQIEQSTFATHSRVERKATRDLALGRPELEDVYVITGK